MSKTKVLHIISSVQLGGAEIVAFRISEGCMDDQPGRFDFIVAELYSSPNSYAAEKRKELESKNIRILTLFRGSKRFSLMIAPLTLFRVILKEKPDFIHIHTDLPDFVAACAIRLLRMFGIRFGRIVRTIHNTVLWPTHHWMGRFTESAFHNDLICAVSDGSLQAYQAIRRKNNLKESDYQQVIFNGCSIPTKEEAPIKPDKQKINIAFCGRFELQKGIDLLIERIRVLNKNYEEKIHFYLIGDGTFKQQVLDLCKQSPNITFYPPISNIANKLHVFDFIIMPSRFEGLVLLSIEASLAGVPVIAANAKGLNETLPKNWPLLFDLSSQDELDKLLHSIANNHFNRENLTKEAFQFVHEKFSLNKMIKSYAKIYQSAG